MPGHVIIDGNNLLHAMQAHAPIPLVARETMVKIIERWARRGSDDVTLVFDGPAPLAGMLQQMTSRRIAVRFSAPHSADDIIVALIRRQRMPDTVRIVSSDTALRHEARHRRCRHTDAVAFIGELFIPASSSGHDTDPSAEKPPAPSGLETQAWIAEFNLDAADLMDDLDRLLDDESAHD